MNYPISAADAPAVNDGTQILNGDHAEKAGFGLSNGMARIYRIDRKNPDRSVIRPRGRSCRFRGIAVTDPRSVVLKAPV